MTIPFDRMPPGEVSYMIYDGTEEMAEAALDGLISRMGVRELLRRMGVFMWRLAERTSPPTRAFAERARFFEESVVEFDSQFPFNPRSEG